MSTHDVTRASCVVLRDRLQLTGGGGAVRSVPAGETVIYAYVLCCDVTGWHGPSLTLSRLQRDSRGYANSGEDAGSGRVDVFTLHTLGLFARGGGAWPGTGNWHVGRKNTATGTQTDATTLRKDGCWRGDGRS